MGTNRLVLSYSHLAEFSTRPNFLTLPHGVVRFLWGFLDWWACLRTHVATKTNSGEDIQKLFNLVI
jgi:hypothetical protein